MVEMEEIGMPVEENRIRTLMVNTNLVMDCGESISGIEVEED